MAETYDPFSNGRRFEALLMYSKIPIFVADETGAIIHANSAMEDFTGYTAGEMKNHTFFELSNISDNITERNFFKNLVKLNRTSYSLTKRWINKTGRVVWGRTTISAVIDSNGNFREAIGIIDPLEIIEETKTRFVPSYKDDKPVYKMIDKVIESKDRIKLVFIISFILINVWLFIMGGMDKIFKLLE